MNEQANKIPMKKKVVEAFLESPPVQKKLEKVARRMSWESDDGRPNVSNKNLVKEAMKEEGMDPDIISDPSSLVSEISIRDDKYEDIVFFPDNNEFFMNTIEDEDLPDPEPPLTKTGEPEDAEDAIDVSYIGQGDPEYEFWIEDSEGKIYHVESTNIGKVKSSFNASSNEGINWSSRGTKPYEVAACFGVVCASQGKEPEELLGSPSTDEERMAAANKAAGIFREDEYDWSDGADDFTNQIESEDGLSVSDVARLATFAQSAYDFIEERKHLSLGNVYFIHGSIGDYYEAEKNNVDTEGMKANTADLVICSKPAEQVISSMQAESSQVSYTGQGENGDVDEGACYFGAPNESPNESEYFYQISHKKAIGENDAQLGKFLNMFRDKIGLEKEEFDNVVKYMSTTLEEGWVSSLKDTASSVKDTATDIVSSAADTGKVFVNKVKGGFEYFRKKFMSGIRNAVSRLQSFVFPTVKSDLEDTSNITDFYSRLASSLEGSQLQEAKYNKSEIEKAMIDAWVKGGDHYKDVIKPFYERTQKRFQKIDEAVQNSPNLGTFSGFSGNFSPSPSKMHDYISKQDIGQNKKEDEKKYVVRQVNSTLQAMKAFYNIIYNKEGERKEMENMVEKFFEIEKEMLFGRTKLPIWKLGASDSKLLGVGETYGDDKPDILEYDGEDHPPLILFQVSPNSNNLWATTNYAVVTDVTEDGTFLYTKYSARSRGGTLDFTTEGRETGLTIDQL